MNETIGIGVMSGTSMDGIDLAICRFKRISNTWRFDIVHSKTFDYDDHWRNELAFAHSLNSFELLALNKDFGNLIGDLVNQFIKNAKVKVDFIASHGHTIFHQPDKGITYQIGDGASIAEKTGIKTVTDFRYQDVILGGNGAPLVPIGDELLFSEYEYCLNLGGFSNVSLRKNGKRIAFDICPVNTIINYLSKKLDRAYDNKGRLAIKGSTNKGLLEELENLDYYSQPIPKSLGREWLWSSFVPIVDASNIKIEDQLRTVYEHISNQITKSLNNNAKSKVLLTGGGVYNDFLVELIGRKTANKLIIPTKQIIAFKEAAIFAFLGLLKINNEVNCLSSVTGAKRDHSSGVIYEL